MYQKLLVSNLPDGADETELQELFESFGRVDFVKITRRYAIVQFEDSRAAEIAFAYGVTLRAHRLNIKEAQW
ncbi:MAG: recognition motif [Candidatus Sulfotelmatobacter sp.]|nr:recognition motif [Candidatus Sulfotelmatobacter sp.]